MNLLFDTNVFIALEPTRLAELEESALPELLKLIIDGRHGLYLHPAQRLDVGRDRDDERRSLRQLLFTKYPLLPHPPALSLDAEALLGRAAPSSNDWVDHQLLGTLAGDAIDILVTSDIRLRRKAGRLGLEGRIATPNEVVSLLRDLFDRIPPPHPSVKAGIAHQLDSSDPIFDSFKQDYPGFDAWLSRCKREQRKVWIIPGAGGHLAGMAIVKPEKETHFGLRGRILKICSLKVSERHNGFRFGELLLKTLFDYGADNNYDAFYVTVFPKYEALISLLNDFGFEVQPSETKLGEKILVKRFVAPPGQPETDLSPLAYNVKYGPRALLLDGVAAYVIPILPTYHALLFPEAENQPFLIPDSRPCGNAIRKAYLCYGGIRKVTAGDLLLFYRSDDFQAITVVGIAEEATAFSQAEELARYVGKRTVYRYDEICAMCRRDREVLAILFRQSRALRDPISLSELKAQGALRGAPQTVTTLPGGTLQWMRNRI